MLTHQNFYDLIDAIRKKSLDTLVSKNQNYAGGNEDPLHNFRVGAKMIDGTPAQAAWGYMTKHLVALHDKIERNNFSDAADLEEKCQDIINYIAIIYAIGMEEHTDNLHVSGRNAAGEAYYDPMQLLIPGYPKEEQ